MQKMLSNWTIRVKLVVGFGTVLLCLVVLGGVSVMDIKTIVNNSKEVIYGNSLDSLLAQKEIDHLNWLKTLNSFMNGERVEVKTDDKTCSLGSWLYSKDRKQAEEKIPGLKSVLKAIEEPHHVLHESAHKITQVFKKADANLPTKLVQKEGDILRLVGKINDAFILNQPIEMINDDWDAWMKDIIFPKSMADKAKQAKEEYLGFNSNIRTSLEFYSVVHLGLQEGVMAGMISFNYNNNLILESILKQAKSDEITTAPLSKLISSDPWQKVLAENSEMTSYAKDVMGIYNALKTFYAEITELIRTEQWEQALILYKENKDNPALIIKLKTILKNESLIVEDRQMAIESFKKRTMKYANKLIALLGELKLLAETEMKGQKQALNIYNAETAPALNQIRDSLHNTRKTVKSNIMTDDIMISLVNKSLMKVIIIMAVSIVFSLIFAILIGRNLAVSIRRLVKSVEGMVAGDMTMEFPNSVRGDEIGLLARKLKGLSENLRSIFQKLSIGVATLNESSTILSEVSANVKTGANDTTVKSSLVAQATEEMTTNMGAVNIATNEANNGVAMVSLSVDQMAIAIQEIAEKSGIAKIMTDESVNNGKEALNQIQILQNKANAISKITETITEISAQTNLLALNATIEAARAGEAGKGFAVVAGEIKELSKKTAEAITDINKTIADMQIATNSTTGEITTIIEGINGVSEVVSTVATAVEEQSATTKEISHNVSQVSNGVESVSAKIAQNSAVVENIATEMATVHSSASGMMISADKVNTNVLSLVKLSEELSGIISHFKI